MTTKRIVKKNESDSQVPFYIEVSTVEIEDDTSSKKSSKKRDLSPVGVSEKVQDFANSLDDLIKGVSSSILKGALAENNAPNKVTAEFNVELSAEGGLWFVAKGEAKTGLTISLEWDLSVRDKIQN